MANTNTSQQQIINAMDEFTKELDKKSKVNSPKRIEASPSYEIVSQDKAKETDEKVDWVPKYLEALYRNHGIVIRSCVEVGINRMTVHRRKRSDPKFAEALGEVSLSISQDMEDALIENALGINNNGSQRAREFWLTKNNPKYADKLSIEQTVQHSIVAEQRAFAQKMMQALDTLGIDEAGKKRFLQIMTDDDKDNVTINI